MILLDDFIANTYGHADRCHADAERTPRPSAQQLQSAGSPTPTQLTRRFHPAFPENRPPGRHTPRPLDESRTSPPHLRTAIGYYPPASSRSDVPRADLMLSGAQWMVNGHEGNPYDDEQHQRTSSWDSYPHREHDPSSPGASLSSSRNEALRFQTPPRLGTSTYREERESNANEGSPSRGVSGQRAPFDRDGDDRSANPSQQHPAGIPLRSREDSVAPTELNSERGMQTPNANSPLGSSPQQENPVGAQPTDIRDIEDIPASRDDPRAPVSYQSNGVRSRGSRGNSRSGRQRRGAHHSFSPQTVLPHRQDSLRASAAREASRRRSMGRRNENAPTTNNFDDEFFSQDEFTGPSQPQTLTNVTNQGPCASSNFNGFRTPPRQSSQNRAPTNSDRPDNRDSRPSPRTPNASPSTPTNAPCQSGHPSNGNGAYRALMLNSTPEYGGRTTGGNGNSPTQNPASSPRTTVNRPRTSSNPDALASLSPIAGTDNEYRLRHRGPQTASTPAPRSLLIEFGHERSEDGDENE